MSGVMEQKMPFPPRHGVRVMALCPPRTGRGILGIQEKAVALAASVLNIVGTVTPGLPGTYALTGGPQTQETEECLLNCLLRLLVPCGLLPVSAVMMQSEAQHPLNVDYGWHKTLLSPTPHLGLSIVPNQPRGPTQQVTSCFFLNPAPPEC